MFSQGCRDSATKPSSAACRAPALSSEWLASAWTAWMPLRRWSGVTRPVTASVRS